jgi:hypothetical protein
LLESAVSHKGPSDRNENVILNYQGFGNTPLFQALLDVQRRCDPGMMFLPETNEYLTKCLRRRLKIDFKIVNASNGGSGGVIMLWKKKWLFNKFSLQLITLVCML